MKSFPLLSLALFACAFAVPALAQTIQVPETSAKQAYIIDYDTGAVLLDKNGSERMPTSSMSKVLTSIVAYDAIHKGEVKPDQLFTVSEKAWKQEGSRMFLDVNTQVSVADLLHGVEIQSGNDACVALAEGIAGSEANYVVMMNQKAKEIGMNDSNFMNSNGLPDPNHYSTAHDLALLGSYLIHNYPDEYKLYSQKEFTYNNIKQGNRNPLLYKNIGADGIKTGHTDVGGYGMMGSAVAGDRRVIMVINGTTSMQARADESSKLMEWALTNFKNLNIVKKGAVVAEAPVVLSDTRKIGLVTALDYKATVPTYAKDGGVQITATYQSPLVAPIQQGQEVGKLTLTLANGSVEEIPLLAGSGADESSFFKRIGENFMIMLVGTAK